MNILFIGLVKFELKQWFSAYQNQFCAWFSLPRLPTETARVFFRVIFLKGKGFIFLLPASHTCFMPQQEFFCTLSFAQSRKMVSKLSKLSAILKHGGKIFVMMMSIVRLSSNRS